jgi:hypothetical protein
LPHAPQLPTSVWRSAVQAAGAGAGDSFSSGAPDRFADDKHALAANATAAAAKAQRITSNGTTAVRA